VAAVTQFHAALAKGDAAAAAALLDPAATIFEEGYVERTKAEYVAGHLPADIEFTRAVKETLDRRDVVAGSEMAVVTSESRIQGTFKEKAVDRISIETMVLRRGPGGWRIVHIHWSGRPAPKASS
jgi:ketosteroid isomerase-like protein